MSQFDKWLETIYQAVVAAVGEGQQQVEVRIQGHTNGLSAPVIKTYLQERGFCVSPRHLSPLV